MVSDEYTPTPLAARCVRGRSGRGKEHIGLPPESGTLWSRTACGLTCLPQFPGVWAKVAEADKCWNCKVFHGAAVTQ